MEEVRGPGGRMSGKQDLPLVLELAAVPPALVHRVMCDLGGYTLSVVGQFVCAVVWLVLCYPPGA